MPPVHRDEDADILPARRAYQATSRGDCGAAGITHGLMPTELGPTPALFQHGDGEERLPVEPDLFGDGDQQRGATPT